MADSALVDAFSDYGSDFDVEDDAIVALLSHSATEQKAAYVSHNKQRAQPCSPTSLFAPVVVESAQSVGSGIRSPSRKGAVIEVEYDEPSREFWSTSTGSHAPPTPTVPKTEESDTRSPLQRFRMKPLKPLSVTDLVSPAWCELQFWYNLTKFGRKPRTAAMKRGTVVHETLEKQVHDYVPIQVKTKEDKVGLKIWNVIQGLRCLRLTGMTRELEVWGIIDGELVNGIIDELSYTLPDADLDKVPHDPGQNKKAENNTRVSSSTRPANALVGDSAMLDHWLGGLEPDKTVYITDVKTRGVKSIPSGATLRPTYMQLMLYRKLLVALASNLVDADFVFARYSLDPLEPFSAVFVSEVNGTGFDLHQTDSDDDNFPVGNSQSTSKGELDVHNNLSALWSLMITEFSRAIPFASISKALRAEFRWTRTGDIIGSHMFLYDDVMIDEYVSSEMSWWKGKRAVRGVEVEEAFKCRTCDFAETCSWRIGKVEEATLKHRLRAAGRAKSSV